MTPVRTLIRLGDVQRQKKPVADSSPGVMKRRAVGLWCFVGPADWPAQRHGPSRPLVSGVIRMYGPRKMASKLSPSIGLCIFLAACSHQLVWVNPGASESDFAEATRVCAIRSQQGEAYMNGPAGSARTGPAAHSASFDDCMNARGWYLRRVPNS